MRVDRTTKPAANNTAISEIMTTEVVCVSPELSVELLTKMMIERGFSGAPVVDANNKPIGVVSKTDVLRSSIDARAPLAVTVGAIMTPVAFTLSENATIAEAAALMAYEGTHRVPAIASDGAVAGIVSTIDVLRWIAETEGYLVGRPVRR
jgi:CBS domain-containing protein